MLRPARLRGGHCPRGARAQGRTGHEEVRRPACPTRYRSPCSRDEVPLGPLPARSLPVCASFARSGAQRQYALSFCIGPPSRFVERMDQAARVLLVAAERAANELPTGVGDAAGAGSARRCACRRCRRQRSCATFLPESSSAPRSSRECKSRRDDICHRAAIVRCEPSTAKSPTGSVRKYTFGGMLRRTFSQRSPAETDLPHPDRRHILPAAPVQLLVPYVP
ncbi:MAG: hypothetical protein KatS3mg077_2121 [Candidatus Binatia bacterium]|nr:MAG: hypothetical protein KatS3mg077_2121 [Candidatus Binatia bacterium]